MTCSRFLLLSIVTCLFARDGNSQGTPTGINADQITCPITITPVVLLAVVPGTPGTKPTVACYPLDPSVFSFNPATGILSLVIGSQIVGETPAGLVDGTNAVFALSRAPVRPSTLIVHRNGLRLKAGADYTATGATITFFSATATSKGTVPQQGDALIADFW